MAAAVAAAGRLGWLFAALCLGNAAGEAAPGPRVLGFCLEEDGAAGAGWVRGGAARDTPDATFLLRLFGPGFANSSWSWVAPEGAGCREEAASPAGEWRALLRLRLRAEAVRPHSALLAVRVEPGGGAAEEAAPPWALGLGAAGLLALAALARGLQLSALALAPAEVQVLRESGSEAERAAARRLEPARRWAGCALGALLLLASLAQAALAVLLYRAAGQRAVPAVLGSAGLVFLVGEVVPAAVSGRWTLALAPRALGLSRLAVLLTLPVALPVGQLLELAARPGRLRERVLELARGGGDPYSDLSKGVLRCRTVEDVLTPLEDCFMLDASTVLDFGVLASIMQSGHTRIPVYEEERSNIVDMLYLKDLAFVDPEDCTPLSTITRFYNHPLHFVFNDTKLDAVLEEFKRGDTVVKRKPASLMAPLKRKEEFSLFKVSDDEYKVTISPQLLLATQRFLSREVDVFSPLRISEKVLLHLLKHPSVNQEVRFDESNRLATHHYLYQRSQPVDYFILILQGRVEVEIGKEGLKFENGAFTYYGVSALTVPSSVHQSPVSSLQPIRHDLQPDPGDGTHSSAYCPDYTVRALSDLQLIKVTRLQYLNALLATRAQNLPQSPENTDLQVIPGSQTRLLGEKTTTAAGSSHSRPGVPVEGSPGRNPGV
ncbi:cyclin and CBS domain divalent metal cation transport mediator 3 [Homo sapiens]|uniref:Isoform 2 of Metal transporter CNNM3 n=1 Tax=Homo sapiens TaxID=9606 RepID=Q8NE01-2|nr:metal transporter CNNM3 isoform 2 precursor [Homo sapiens]KAI2524364.1 cyclin and CBS domain divalent metal cation transport mediator 3 [Homo sapiens]KAI4035516.1 cyclin and CBS domain divalent metal cation transport mediator 3 [Homo sapiens]|eukprot:NP_951060.1 metal transporter CNNM3 isoform 2 precursor [Homo sapiens]